MLNSSISATRASDDHGRLLVDEDVAAAIAGMDLRHVAGRVLVVIENNFYDLATCIAGPCTAAREGGLDYRWRSLLRLRYEPSAETGKCACRALEERGVAFSMPQPPVHVGSEAVPQVRYGRGIFIPFEASACVRNVSIDAFENASTVLTLSHWPSAGTPEPFRADLSATSVFRYLDARGAMPCDCVTSDHFDVDGLVGVAAALEPDWAQKNRALLLKIAECGDFNIGYDATARRVSLAINSLAADRQAQETPRQKSHAESNTELFGEFLMKLPDMLRNVDQYEAAWGPEEEVFATTEQLFLNNKIGMVATPEVDLTVFELPDAPEVASSRELAETNLRYCGLSSISFHNRCSSGTLVLVGNGRYEVRQRYETWVAKRSAVPLPRRDLSILAEGLNGLESSSCGWVYDGVEQITPALRWSPGESSSLQPEMFLRLLVDFLRVAPPAWRPLVDGRCLTV
jgi:hypothetical protein